MRMKPKPSESMMAKAQKRKEPTLSHARANIPAPSHHGFRQASSHKHAIGLSVGRVMRKLAEPLMKNRWASRGLGILREVAQDSGRLFVSVDLSFSMRTWFDVVQGARDKGIINPNAPFAVWAERCDLVEDGMAPNVGDATYVESLVPMANVINHFDRLVIFTDGEFTDGLASCSRLLSGLGETPPITWIITPFGTDRFIVLRNRDKVVFF